MSKTITIIGATKVEQTPNLIGVINGSDLTIEGDERLSVFDGYHTMDELYEHRIMLFIALCKMLWGMSNIAKMVKGEDEAKKHGAVIDVWRSKKHSDGELAFGGTWFVLGIGKENGEQITYHLPIEKWDETFFAETLDVAPEWDGHTSADVLKRLKKI